MKETVQENTVLRLLLTGGGTGGHLFPAIASAQKLIESYPKSVVQFVGTRRKMDGTSLKKAGFSTRSILCYGLKGKSLPELVKALAVLPISCVQSLWILMRFKPDIVLGVGGYVTGPVVFVAKLLGIPTVIHEQNSIPGLANRKLASFVEKICISLPGSDTLFPLSKVVLTGNPVRKEIIEKAAMHKKRDDSFTLLVLGGSQGAHGVNLLVTEAVVKHIQQAGKPIKIIHQTGSADYQEVEDTYTKNGVDGEVSPFFDNMANLYHQADLVVSRAGATTLSELAVTGTPAMLIPYPTAADNHQKVNADHYVSAGGAMIFEEGKTDARTLADQILDLHDDRESLAKMAKAMQSLAIPDAAQKIVDTCLSLVSKDVAIKGV